MIEALSNRIAHKLKEINPEETASIEVMSYALQGILHNAITVLTALTFGLCLGHFWDTVIAATCFTLLRLVSGGFHFRSALACFISSSIVFIAIPMITTTNEIAIIINAASLILVSIFAPSNIQEHIRVSERYFVVFKLLSVLLVAVNFFYLSSIVTLAFFVQAYSLVSLKRR